MKKAAIFIVGLLAVAGVAEWIIVARSPIDPRRLAALLVCLSLVLGAFVALTDSGFVRQLREWALGSATVALTLPLVLLIPYFILALGTRTFSAIGLAKLTAYILAPVALLLPDRLHRATRVGWRDFVAMTVLAVPVAAHWLGGIWMWPEDLYFFRPLYSVLVGGYAFMAVRHLDGVGYRLIPRKDDLKDGFAHFVAFSIVAIPLGFLLGFIHFHHPTVHPWTLTMGWAGTPRSLVVPEGWTLFAEFMGEFLGIYISIAIPEELLFRGILQNFLAKSFTSERRGLWGLLIASVVFGASHLHHVPVPNWRYAILATIAGLFYGNAYRTRQRLPCSALTHALVDAVWHFWF
jgi:CAAX protease family protein